MNRENLQRKIVKSLMFTYRKSKFVSKSDRYNVLLLHFIGSCIAVTSFAVFFLVQVRMTAET